MFQPVPSQRRQPCTPRLLVHTVQQDQSPIRQRHRRLFVPLHGLLTRTTATRDPLQDRDLTLVQRITHASIVSAQ